MLPDPCHYFYRSLKPDENHEKLFDDVFGLIKNYLVKYHERTSKVCLGSFTLLTSLCTWQRNQGYVVAYITAKMFHSDING